PQLAWVVGPGRIVVFVGGVRSDLVLWRGGGFCRIGLLLDGITAGGELQPIDRLSQPTPPHQASIVARPGEWSRARFQEIRSAPTTCRVTASAKANPSWVSVTAAARRTTRPAPARASSARSSTE